MPTCLRFLATISGGVGKLSEYENLTISDVVTAYELDQSLKFVILFRLKILCLFQELGDLL